MRIPYVCMKKRNYTMYNGVSRSKTHKREHITHEERIESFENDRNVQEAAETLSLLLNGDKPFFNK